MSYEILRTEQRDRIVYVTIDRPKALNALNHATFSELHRFFGTDYQEHKDISGVVITGAGGRAFVAGADIKEFLDLGGGDNARAMSSRGQDIFLLIERFHVPVIALIDGFALGGGCELAMACHLRVATKSARFGQPEVNLGIIPGYGGTQRLNQYIGKTKATELILTGDMIDADEALRLGLINYVLPDRDAALTKAEELLKKMATKGPIAIRESIRAINAYYENKQGYVTESEAFGQTSKTADFREGAAAFVEKRSAVFQGR